MIRPKVRWVWAIPFAPLWLLDEVLHRVPPRTYGVVRWQICQWMEQTYDRMVGKNWPTTS